MVLDLCCESAEGKETVAVATARRDLGRVLALQRKFDRAEEQYKVRALVPVYLNVPARAHYLLHCLSRLLSTCVPVCWARRTQTLRAHSRTWLPCNASRCAVRTAAYNTARLHMLLVNDCRASLKMLSAMLRAL